MNGWSLVPALALVVSVAVPALAQDTSDRTKAWTNYETFLWMHQGPPAGPETYRAMRDLGVYGQNVDGLASDELPVKHGMHFYVGHSAGKGYLYLYRNVWKENWEKYKESRDPQLLIRPNCVNNPKARQWLEQRVTKSTTGHRAGHPVAYALDDEISVTSFANPFDFCFGPYCMEKFHAWLEGTYGSLGALNAEWETAFRSWDDVKPLTTWEIRQREYAKAPETYNFSPWADHRTFMDTTWAEALGRLVALTNRLDPTRPCGFVGAQAPSAFGGYDWYKLMQVIDWVEPYDIGGSREIIRSFSKPGTRVVKTVFKAKGGRPDQVYSLWYYFAHGDAGSIIWSSGDYFTNQDAGKPTEYALSLRSVFHELQGGLAEKVMLSEYLPSPIAIYYSQPSIQVHWMLDSKQDGDTWLNRFSSWESTHSSLIADRLAWMVLIEDLGLQYEFIAYGDVKQGVLRSGRYRVIILPKTIALSDEEVEELTAFVKAGGLLIADYQTALFDGHGRSRGRGALDELFGVSRRDHSVAEDYGKVAKESPGRALGLAVMEPTLRAAGGLPRGKAGDIPYLLRKETARGAAVYLNLGVMDYRSQRLGPKGNPAFLAEMRRLLAQAGVEADVTVRSEGKELPLCERIWRRKGDELFLFILKNVAPSATPTGEAGEESKVGTAPIDIQVTLAGPARVTSVRTGKLLGDGDTFTDTLLPYEANIYQVVWKQ